MWFTARICGASGFINQLLPSAGNIITQNYSHLREKHITQTRRHKGKDRIVKNVFSLLFESWGICSYEKESAGTGHNLLAEVAGQCSAGFLVLPCHVIT